VNDETRARPRRAVSDEDKSQRRDEIIAAAKKVFARKGFHATTIADVAKEAGLAYGSIYWYFDSKDDLFHTLIAAEEYALRTHVAVALAASGTRFGYAEAPFRATLQAVFEYFEADKATTKLLFRDAYALDNRFDKHLGSIYERFIDDIATLILAAQERGDVRAAPPRLVAYTLTSLIGHMAHRRLTADDGVSAAEAADFVVSFVINGLRPRERSTRADPRKREGTLHFDAGAPPPGGVPAQGAASSAD
jgi:AcrR family transcriptional regulator